MALDFGKMYGPLPLGAWAAVVAGGVGIMFYTRSQESAATDPTMQPEDTSGTPGVGEGGSGMYWQDVAPPDTSGVAPGAPVDNDAWGVQAVNYLIAQGYDPAVSDSAIRKYLGAEKVSSQEYALIKVALAHLGSPPVPLPPPVFAPPGIPHPPTHKPPPKKPPHHKPPHASQGGKNGKKFQYYTVKPGDTLIRIARKVKGNQTWQQIYNANRAGQRRADGKPGMIHNANLIRPGWKLLIP